jgi:hypothetical protein
MNWTLDLDGDERTFAEWGFSQLQRKRVSQGTDEVTFVADARNVDAADLFTPFSDTLIIRRDRIRDSGSLWSGGTKWFEGIVIQIPRRGSPNEENNSYVLAGPWWYLDNLVFEKTFNILDHYTVPADPTSEKVYRQVYMSHCFLNLASTAPETPLGKQTTGQQITEALNWARKPFVDASATPPFQIGTITPDVDPPFDEVRDITCAEVIHKMLRFSPDAVTWFDYATSPPTFHCKRRADLAEVNLAFAAGNLITDLSINARYDLQSSYVLIRYEQNNTVDGVSWMGVAIDQYPDPLPTDPRANFSALRFTVDLQGQQSSNTRARLAVQAFDTSNPQWWLARHPQYRPFGASSDYTDADPTNPIASFEIVGGTVQRQPSTPGDTDHAYPRELIDGQIADWMGFNEQRLTFTCRANIVFRNGHSVRNHTVSVPARSTNATSGSFQTSQVTTQAEPIPVGLARKLYDAISVLQFEGSLTLLEEEVTGQLSIGQLFNILGSDQTAWATMKGMVQQITENVDAGTTTIEFGPPHDLGANDLVELLRINRNRLIHYSPGIAISGSATAATEVGLGTAMPINNSPSTPGFMNQSVVSEDVTGAGAQKVTGADSGASFSYWTPQGPANPGAPVGGSVLINTADIAPADKTAGRFLRIRKLNVCQDGAPGTIYVLCSQFVPDP